MYPRNPMPKSWITKSDFVRFPFRFFSEWSPCIQGAQCQSHRRYIRTTEKLEIKIQFINMSPAMTTIGTIILITIWVTIRIQCNTRLDISHQTNHTRPDTRSSNQTQDQTTDQIPDQTELQKSHQTSNQIPFITPEQQPDTRPDIIHQIRISRQYIPDQN